MWDHKTEYHSDKDIDPIDDYRFEVVECYRDPLSRQITEAIRIKQGLGESKFYDKNGKIHEIKDMNRKFEAFAPRERFERGHN